MHIHGIGLMEATTNIHVSRDFAPVKAERSGARLLEEGYERNLRIFRGQLSPPLSRFFFISFPSCKKGAVWQRRRNLSTFFREEKMTRKRNRVFLFLLSLLGDCSARQNVQYIRLPHLSRSAPALVSLAIQQSGEDWPPLR